MGLMSLVFWNAPRVTDALWIYMLLFALSGIPGSALAVGIVTTVQTHSPPAVLGRVVGVMRSSRVDRPSRSIDPGRRTRRPRPLEALLDAQAMVYLVCGGLAWALLAKNVWCLTPVFRVARGEQVGKANTGCPTPRVLFQRS